MAVLGIDDTNITTPDGSKSLTGDRPRAERWYRGHEQPPHPPDADARRSPRSGVAHHVFNSALLGGLVLADVPPFAGVPWPRGHPLRAAARNVCRHRRTGPPVGGSLEHAGFTDPACFKGWCAAVASVGKASSLADSRELSIVDTTPTRIGRLDVPAKCLDAVRAFTSDDNANGTIDLPQEQRDLVFVGDEVGRFLVVNVTQPTTPTLLASIPLPRRPRDIAVDPNERLAYAATDDGVFVIDVSRPADPSGLAFVDVNADGVDDRILGTIDGIDAARSLISPRSNAAVRGGPQRTGPRRLRERGPFLLRSLRSADSRRPLTPDYTRSGRSGSPSAASRGRLARRNTSPRG